MLKEYQILFDIQLGDIRSYDELKNKYYKKVHLTQSASKRDIKIISEMGKVIKVRAEKLSQIDRDIMDVANTQLIIDEKKIA